MIQIYIDGVLGYDSRLRERGKDYALLGLRTTTGENVGGTAEIVLPPGHPAYSQFIEHRSIVEIYRDHALRFRGRALYPTDDFYNRRTWTCEGELCMLQDAVSRPYLYQDSPAAIFTELINTYNSQVDDFKKFVVGDITVTDANDYVRVESESAEQILDTVNKLVGRCGGYIVFTTNAEGARVINWYADPGFRSDQVIEFGSNLLDYVRDGAGTDLATVIIPYGAQKEDGSRVTIEVVNNGLDYIQDDDAVALRGRIVRPVFWDDVAEPQNLLTKARVYLTEHKHIVTSLTLTALDLSYMDKSIDSYTVGDSIRVRSKPHGLDEDFKLTHATDDWLFPDQSSITLGKDVRTLTGADVAGDTKSNTDLQKVSQQIKADYTLNISNALAETERILTSLIQQTSEQIKLEVSQTYTTNDRLDEAISTNMTQLADSFTFSFSQLQAVVDDNAADTQQRFTEISKYIRFDGGNIVLGGSDSNITLTIENDLIVFRKNGAQFGWWDGVDFHTGNIVVEVNERAQFGNFAFVPRSNGSLSFLKVGG